MGNATTNTERDLLIAKAKYHKLKQELLTAQIKLIDAKANLNEARIRGLLANSDIEQLEQVVIDAEDCVTRAEPEVTIASRVVGRLQSKQKRAASHQGLVALLDMVFNPAAGLLDVMLIDDFKLHDRVPRSRFDEASTIRPRTGFPFGAAEHRERTFR